MAKKKQPGKPKTDAFGHFKREKKTLKAPFNVIMEKSPELWRKTSWLDVQMPEYLWVALILGAFEPKDAIARLRRVGSRWPSMSELNDRTVQPGSLSAIGALKRKARKALLNGIFEAVESKEVLAPLCHLAALPGRDDWIAVFGTKESDKHWVALANAVLKCSDFQGDAATHVCWFLSLVGSVSGQMLAAEHLRQDFDERLANYPENSSTAGGIFRCQAGTMRIIPTNWPAIFWKEVYLKLPPDPAPPEDQYLTDNNPGHALFLLRLHFVIADHFWATRQGSDDAIHETAFGVALAAVALVNEVIELRTHTRFGGLAALRMITECTINLSYLVSKKDADQWYRFRQYGMGQAHLISTKLGSSLASAYCVDERWINAFLEEEQAKHFTDIELGDWTGENLRARAQQGGTKDLYDSYYDYSSSLLHGDWLGTVTFGTTWDINPFHRLQHVPRVYPRNIPSVVPDLCRVLNRLLDSLNHLYPGIEFRLPELDLSQTD